MRSRSSRDVFTWFQESVVFMTSPRDLRQLGMALVRGRSGVGLAGVGSVALLLWNAPLVASTGAGMGTMVLMYLLQDEEWRRKLPEVNEQVKTQMASWNRPFVWSALAGGSAAFLSYLALSAWMETDSHWLATGILVQGLMTVGVLGLGVRQAIGRSAARESLEASVKTTDLAAWVQMLSHPDATARLLAVREMTAIGLGESLGEGSGGSLGEKKQVLEYFQLFLGQESEEMVREAVWEGFERLGLEAVGLPGQRDLRLERGLEQPVVRRIGAVLENEESRRGEWHSPGSPEIQP